MPTLPKKYAYKISRNGAFLGVLQGVVDDFQYTQDINTAGTSLTVRVKATIDRSREAVDAIQTEEGVDITTELSDSLLTERQPDLVGNNNSNALVRNNNDIEIVEFSDNHPNGQTVFKGYISKWRAILGQDDEITITCLSYGSELDNYMIEAGLTSDQSQATQDGTNYTFSTNPDTGGPGSGQWTRIYQSFIVGNGVTALKAVEFYLAAGAVGNQVTMRIFNTQAGAEGAGSTGQLASTTVTLNSVSAGVVRFTLPVALAVNPSGTYYARLEAEPGSSATIYSKGSDVYSNGSGHYGFYSGSGISWTNGVTDHPSNIVGDFYFVTYQSTSATNSAFSSQDPSAILRSLLDAYSAAGGTLTYSGSTIDNTGTSVSYTFSVNTVLEGIQKLLSLAPANWYWYVDPATNLIYFKQVNSTADITLVKGRDLAKLDLEATIERLKNIVYFTGGSTGATNLYVKSTDTGSLNAGDRVGLARITDNRVTLSATAQTINQGFLDENSDEKYQTQVTVNDGTIDLNNLRPGKTIGFEGFGNFVDNLILQIVSIQRKPDQSVLSLGVLPRRASVQVEEIRRQLNETQTVANPTTPS